MNIIFKNSQDEIFRVFSWKEKPLNAPESIHLIYRQDLKRLDLTFYPERLEEMGRDFIKIAEISRQQQPGLVFTAETGVKVEVTAEVANTIAPMLHVEESNKTWWQSLGAVAALSLIFISATLNVKIAEEEIKEELKQHVVKIMKRKPPQNRKVQIFTSNFGKRTQKVSAKQSKKSVNRMGALGVLGSLKNSRQRGGVNLNAAVVSAGPGLGGGTAGSGGVQTTLYGKGIVAAPVGVGGNLKGGGGYGTKGKGGGQAGYGSLSLVGSAGTGLVPLGKEAVIQGGLDRDMIAAVINRNMGQVRFCYEQGLQSDPKLTGRVAVNFTIGASGAVKTSSINNTTLNSKIVEDCIMNRLRSWKFPLPEGGVDVKVSYPFLLRRVGRG